jgi:O-antigen/teichoic acid export membrane protein
MRLTPAAGPFGLVAWLRTTTWSARLARRGSGLAAIEGAGLVVGYVSQVLFARWMGPLEYGAYAYVLGWATILHVLPTLGLSNAVLRFIPQYLVERDWPRLAGLIRASWLMSLAAGAALGLVGTGVVTALVAPEPAGIRAAMIAGMWIAPLLAVLNLQTGLVRGLHRIGSAFFPGVLLRPVLLVLAAAAVVALGYRLTAVALLGAVLAVLPVVLLTQLAFFRRARPVEVIGAPPVYAPRTWLSVALPLLVVTACGVAMTRMDVLVVGALAGPADAGLYYAASRTATVMAAALSMANAVAAPQVAGLHARGNRKGMQALTTAITQWAFWPSLAAAVALILLAGPILGLFGRGFVGARLVLTILAVGQLVNTGAGPVALLLNMTGHHQTNLRINLCMLAVKVPLSIVGVLWFGLAGAAVATATTMVVANLWRHRIVSRRLGIHASILHVLARVPRGRR